MTTIVIGAGVIGVTIAYDLQRRGRQVKLVERDSPGRGASYGNAAMIAVSEFLPASRPSVWRRIPGWMLNPEGPVCVRPSYIGHLTPWFVRFVAASRPSKLRAIEAQGAALCKRVYDDLLPLLQETGLESELTQAGSLSVYASEAEFRADREHMEILERFGLPYEVLSSADIRAMEPELTDTIKIATLFPQSRVMRNPYRLVTRLAERFVAIGGVIVQGDVVGFQRGACIQAVRLKSGEVIAADEVVICAGAYSGRLAKLLGEPIPLETERGYHTQIASPGITLHHPIICPAQAFVITPTAGGVRVGGTVEMAGLNAPPNYRRARVTVGHAQRLLPNLQVEGGVEWMGHRPALPDTVPILSASAKTKGLFYATGHGHLGLTYAATTGRLMADLITGVTPPLDLRPYRIDRF